MVLQNIIAQNETQLHRKNPTLMNKFVSLFALGHIFFSFNFNLQSMDEVTLIILS